MAKRTNIPLGEELPRLAADHGLSLRAVARACHVNQSHLSRIVSGQQPASGELAARIADVFELPADYFPEYRLWRITETIETDPTLRDQLFDRYSKS